jgi:predicted permease
MSFLDTLQEMLVILFAIAVGYAARHFGFLGGETDRKISGLLINIALPCMILAAVINGDTLPGVREVLSILLVGAIFYALAFVFVLVVPRLVGGTPGQRGVWQFTMAFSNVGFIGYPVATALFGPGALFYAVILALPFNLLSFTLGPLMLGGRARFRPQQLLNPCVVAAVISLILALGQIRPPEMVGTLLDFVGSIAVPLALMVSGSLLAGLPAKRILAEPKVWLISAIRLLVMPTVLWLLLRGMQLEYILMGVAVSQMAMPVASNGTLLCLEFNGDSESMAQITFLSTVLSIVTIPVIAALLL